MKGKGKQHAARLTKDLKKVYGRRHLCVGCGKPIEVGQTWKFTPQGGKVHYHCAKENPLFGGRQAALEEIKQCTSGTRLTELAWLGVRRGWKDVKRAAEAKYEDVTGKWLSVGGRGPWYKPWQNPAGPTFAQALNLARVAGAKIGDTGGFEPWLVKAKLDARSPQVIAQLRREFWLGVEGGSPSPASLSYRDVEIRKVGQGYRVSTDPESEFESLQDAKRFVDAQRNPGTPRYVPAEDDWPIGPIKWTVIDMLTHRKVTTSVGGGFGVGSLHPVDKTIRRAMWIRVGTRQAAEKFADKLNRADRKGRVTS